MKALVRQTSMGVPSINIFAKTLSLDAKDVSPIPEESKSCDEEGFQEFSDSSSSEI